MRTRSWFGGSASSQGWVASELFEKIKDNRWGDYVSRILDHAKLNCLSDSLGSVDRLELSHR